jgi:hypothetical protein
MTTIKSRVAGQDAEAHSPAANLQMKVTRRNQEAKRGSVDADPKPMQPPGTARINLANEISVAAVFVAILANVLVFAISDTIDRPQTLSTGVFFIGLFVFLLTGALAYLLVDARRKNPGLAGDIDQGLLGIIPVLVIISIAFTCFISLQRPSGITAGKVFGTGIEVCLMVYLGFRYFSSRANRPI